VLLVSSVIQLLALPEAAAVILQDEYVPTGTLMVCPAIAPLTADCSEAQELAVTFTTAPGDGVFAIAVLMQFWS